MSEPFIIGESDRELRVDPKIPVALPKGVGVLIEIDEYFDPRGSYDSGDAADNAEYVRRHVEGELTAYDVALVRVDKFGNMVGVKKFDGAFLPDYLGPSLCGCDVETGGADGHYVTLESVPDDYLRSVAEDLVSEL